MTATIQPTLPARAATPPASGIRGALPPRRTTGMLALALGIVAAVSSGAGSWIPSLWGDEAASDLSAQRSLPSLFMMLGHVDAVHGTYYLGLHAWVALFGTSPFSLRAPSAIAAGIGTAAVVLLCARLGSRRLAIVGGIAYAVLPRLTYAGAEARPYAMDAAMATIVTLLFVELLLRSGRPRWLWGAYAVALCLGTYLFVYLALLALAHAAVLLVVRARGRVIGRWAASAGAALLLTTPVMAAGYAERHQIAFLAGRTVLTTRVVLVEDWFGDGRVAALCWALMAAAIVLGAVAWLRQRARTRRYDALLTGGRQGDPWPWSDRRPGASAGEPGAALASSRRPWLELVALAWLGIPSIVLIGSSPMVHAFTARYLTLCAPAAAILVACGICRLTDLLRSSVPAWVPPVATTIAVLALLGAVAPVYIAQRGPYAMNQSDWSRIATTVHANAHAGDAIVFDDSTRPSRRTRLAMDTDPAAFAGLRDVTLETPYARNTTWHDTDLTVPQTIDEGRLHDARRLWLVEYALPGHVDSYGLAALEADGFRVVRRIREHRSEIIELRRGASQA